MWTQIELNLKPRPRGFHLISEELIQHLPMLETIELGLAHIFIKHTSASLSLNENADPSVRRDFEQYFSRLVPEDQPYYEHTDEGSDDLPAHIKSSILGSSLSLPIRDGRFNIGIWQGIYLCEHRNYGGSRTIVITLQGQIAQV